MLKSVGLYFAANILNSLIPLMLMPVLTRYLTVSEYGEVAVFTAIVGFFSALVGTVFVGSVGRKYFDTDLSDQDYAGYIGAAISLGAIGCSVVFLFICLFGSHFSDWLSIDLDFIYIALAVAFFGFLIQVKMNQYQVRKQPMNYAKLQISWAAINALLSLVAVVVYGLGAEGRVNAQFVSAFFVMATSIYLLGRSKQVSFTVLKFKYYRELLLFGLPLLPHVLGGYLLNSVDRIIISNKLDLESAGIYAVAFQLAASAGLVFDAINKAFQPWLFEMLNKNCEKERIKIVKLTYSWFVILILAFFLAAIVGPELLIVIAGEKYSSAGSIFIILLLAQVFKGMYFGVVNYCFYVKRTGWLSLSSIILGFFQLSLLFLFIAVFGLVGAAYAYAVSMGLRFIMTWWVSVKLYQMPWFSIK